MKSPTICLALLLWLAASPTPGVEAVLGAAAAAPEDGLQHCVGPDGVTIYTDQRCSDLQAVEQVPPAKPPERPGVLVSVRSLRAQPGRFPARGALGAGKPRREPARRVLPLVRHGHGGGLPPDGAAGRLRRAAPGRCPAGFEHAEPEPDYPPGSSPYPEVIDPLRAGRCRDRRSPRRARATPADLLRVDQMRSSEDLGIQATYFHLRSNAGCWWMQF